jgi:hypothetical protein
VCPDSRRSARGGLNRFSASAIILCTHNPKETNMNRAKLIGIAGAVGLSAFLVVLPSLAEPIPLAAGAAAGEVTGTVVVVNTAKRLMTIRKPDGDFQVIHVPEEVKRLDEIKINDTLTVAYTEAVAVDLQKGPSAASPGAVVTREIEREPGKKPEGSMAETVTLTGLIKAVNPSNSTVIVEGPKETVTLTVENPALLADVAVGDTVSATFIRAVAAKVESSRPAKEGSHKPGT